VFSDGYGCGYDCRLATDRRNKLDIRQCSTGDEVLPVCLEPLSDSLDETVMAGE